MPVDAGVFTLIERCIGFSLGSLPICRSTTTPEAMMFGMEPKAVEPIRESRRDA